MRWVERRLTGMAILFELSLGAVAVLIGMVLRFDVVAAVVQVPSGGYGPGVYGSGGHLAPTMAVLWGILATTPPLGVFVAFLYTRWDPARRIRVILRRLLDPLLRGLSVPGAIGLALAAGVGEELLFRGLLLAGLIGAIGVVPALLLSSLVFGLLHWITPAYGIYAAVFGLYLGAIYIVSGSLVAPIVVHALYDGVALVLLSRESHEMSDKNSMEAL